MLRFIRASGLDRRDYLRSPPPCGGLLVFRVSTDWADNGRRTGRQTMTTFNFPLRQSDSRPSPKAQAVAARVRVNADRRGGVKTPTWIVALSKTPAAK